MNLELVEKIRSEKEINLKMGGESAIKKQHGLSKLTVRERLVLLADKDSFLEFGLLADHSPTNADLANKITPCDGVITGTCLIEGRPAAVVAYDFTVVAGSMGEVGERKVERMRKLALEERIPIIWLLDSAGARIQEFAGAHFAGIGSLFYEQVELSGVVPQVAAVMGPTAAGTSYIAALADYAPMVRGTSSMALAGPPLVKAVIGEEISTEDLGGSKIHCQISGVGDGEFVDDKSCLEAIRKYLSYFPSHCEQKPPVKAEPENIGMSMGDDILSVVPENPRQGFDMKKVIRPICDYNDFFEIKPEFAPNMIVGFGRIKGRPVGFVANQSLVMGGVIDVNAADKASRFMLSCDAFQIPLIFLHDCPGFMVGSQVEKAGIIRHGAKMLHVVASLTVPKLSVVIRKSYGAGYFVMCGKGLKPDFIVGWPTAEISLMGAEGAVSIVMKNESDTESKAQKVSEYKANIGGLISAKQAHIDDIIDPRETRQILYKALQFMQHKRAPIKTRKRGVMPV